MSHTDIVSSPQSGCLRAPPASDKKGAKPTRLAVDAVGSDLHQAGLCLEPQLVGLEAIAEPQLGYIYS